MSAIPTLSAAQAEVHAEIGRSLLFFQSLERAEKDLLRLSGRTVIASPTPKIDSPAAPSPKATLGQLIDPILEHVLREAPDPDRVVLPSDGTHISAAFHFGIELSEEDRESIRLRLQRAVAVRNDLVHHSLDWLKIGSVEQCQTACDLLRRERAEFESLLRMFQGILAPLPELMRRGVIEVLNQLQAKSDSAGVRPAAPTRSDTTTPA